VELIALLLAVIAFGWWLIPMLLAFWVFAGVVRAAGAVADFFNEAPAPKQDAPKQDAPKPTHPEPEPRHPDPATARWIEHKAKWDAEFLAKLKRGAK
jgi:hypothetical protein